MGSSSKTASAPADTPAPSSTVPYGQTSPDNYSWTNYLPNPATGDPIRPAQLSDPTWQSSVPVPSQQSTAAASGQDTNTLKALLALMMMGQGSDKVDSFGSSRGGGGLGGNYGTSGGGQSSHSYGRTSSGTRSSAHAGGGKWGGK